MQARPVHARRGFTLIEMIGVLAIMAIMAAVLVPRTVEAILRARGDAETANLVNFETGLRQHIRLNKNIPGNVTWPPDTWAANVAAQMGYSAAAVTTNSSNNTRRYLVSPAFVGALPAFPYPQGTAGLAAVPADCRILIVGSVGRALPALNPINQGQFDEIWNTAEGDVPASWGWPVNVRDSVKIQRIHLGDMFVQLTLNNTTISGPRYSIDGSVLQTAAPSSAVTAVYLTSTMVDLWPPVPGIALQLRQVLEKSLSSTYTFTYSSPPDYWTR